MGHNIQSSNLFSLKHTKFEVFLFTVLLQNILVNFQIVNTIVDMVRQQIKSTRKVSIRLRKDIFLKPSSSKAQMPNIWHIPQNGKQSHVRRLFTESLPFGRAENTALDSKAQLGYDGDHDDTDDEVASCKGRRKKVYYEGKIGGPIATTWPYKDQYSLASPGYSPLFEYEVTSISMNNYSSYHNSDCARRPPTPFRYDYETYS